MAKKKVIDLPVATTPTDTTASLIDALAEGGNGERSGPDTRLVQPILEGREDEVREIGHVFMCPACKHPHPVYHVEDKIDFNGDEQAPSFVPAVEIRFVVGASTEEQVCNATVTKGQITFNEGCSHDHVGETMALPSFTAVAGEMSHGA